MTQAGDHNEDDIALTGEYALHLLDAAERLAFEKRLSDEPSLRGLLREWDESFVAFADEITPETPPSRIKNAIEARLFGTTSTARRGVFSLFGLREAMLGLAFVAALGVFFAPQLWDSPETPAYIAEITAEDRALVVQASFSPDAGELAIHRSAGAAATGRSLELWLIADGAEAPVSLGVIPDDNEGTITIPEALRTAMVGGTLAISDEPLGGSPTGAPTGAVLAVGPILPS